jgi:hypothetical protein
VVGPGAPVGSDSEIGVSGGPCRSARHTLQADTRSSSPSSTCSLSSSYSPPDLVIDDPRASMGHDCRRRTFRLPREVNAWGRDPWWPLPSRCRPDGLGMACRLKYGFLALRVHLKQCGSGVPRKVGLTTTTAPIEGGAVPTPSSARSASMGSCGRDRRGHPTAPASSRPLRPSPHRSRAHE